MTLEEDLEPGLVVLRAWCEAEEVRLMRERRVTRRMARTVVSGALAQVLGQRLETDGGIGL